jgi:NAD(P)-dependent dehydrogenase (short-subunit alcohol dehydrogenase family)
LSGETAISVRLRIAEEKLVNVNSNSSSPANEETDPEFTDVEPFQTLQSVDREGFVVPPVGSFRKHCNICKQQFSVKHPFYHLLCGRCGDFNLEKRLQTSDMDGYICLVTGGRVRIGYQICLKLLRAKATVITTTRWPRDAVLRYSSEHDYELWSKNLSIDYLELSDIPSVEAYCDKLAGRYRRIHVLINNAAQTITRPAEWTTKMNALESDSFPLTLTSSETLARITDGIVQASNMDLPPAGSNTVTSVMSKYGTEVIRRSKDDSGNWITLDGSGQPLDLSGVNSWSKRLGEISTEECIQTLAVNVTAPFVFCSKLKHLLLPAMVLVGDSRLNNEAGHIVNVTALEGKFNVGKKSAGHPHTNMAKAALNMLTLTAARYHMFIPHALK